jgi:hypothetical protein
LFHQLAGDARDPGLVIDLGAVAAEDGEGLVAVKPDADLGQDAQALVVNAVLLFL